MAEKEYNHSQLALPADPEFLLHRPHIEVWSNDRDEDRQHHVTLYLRTKGAYAESDTFYADLLPSEARALAALLVMGADDQERRAKLRGDVA
jgi:hypothetical protein